MMEHPVGFSEAAKDWNRDFAGRDYSINDWNNLTLGEQNRYAVAECKTKGAVYKSRINSSSIEFSVNLPQSLSLKNLCSTEAEIIERWLHKAIEKEIAAIIQLREISGGKLPCIRKAQP